MPRPGKITLLLCLVLAAAAAARLTRRPPPLIEAERPPRPVAPAADLALAASPSHGDVAEALRRVFAGTVTPLGADPPFVVADLNGDGSEDLVTPVRASEPRLREVNDVLANWVIQDLGAPPPTPSAVRKGVAAGEALLAVIHGHGPGGWRNVEARQAYLLRNATGVELKRAGRGELAFTVEARRPRGDVLLARLEGKRGFLYWTGAGYALGR